jgi:hypothetical protein
MTDKRLSIFGDTIFCDDIRFELGNKFSFIGVYNGAMFFSEELPFPITIPKLCMNVRIFMPVDMHPDRIDMMVYFPGDKDDSPTFKQPIENLPPRQKIVEDLDMTEARGVFSAPFIFSPVQLLSVGAIKVRANIKGETIRLGSLFVRTQPAVTPAV